MDINKIPYRDGVQALNDLAEGRIQVYLTALAIIRPHLEAGKVRLIAIANQERAPYAPNVPTANEAGFPKLTFDGNVGLFGSRDMTEEFRNRIAADVQAVASDAAIVKQLEASSQLVRPGSSSEFAAAIDTAAFPDCVCRQHARDQTEAVAVARTALTIYRPNSGA